MRILSRKFYFRNPAIVARKLLGKILVRKIKGKIISGKIVETEAYFSKEEDPASKASMRSLGKCYRYMSNLPGKTFIYIVHNNWLLNIVAHEKGKIGAVLIRAMEPMNGIEIMKRNRKVENIFNLTNGPGKLTRALHITNELNEIDVTKEKSPINICQNKNEKFEISSSHRIGVTKDLEQELRFFILGNLFVSKIKI